MNILIIEDDASIQMLLKLSLEVEGYRPSVAGSVAEGLDILAEGQTDLVLLDLMLPDRSGFELLQQLQRQYRNIPVIVLTAKNEMNDKILGFQLGADDYLTKPFETRELVERIKAVMRRMRASQPPSETVAIGCIEIDRRERSCRIAGKPLKTTSKEFDFLWLLCTNPKKVFTREELLDQVWGYEYYGHTRSVDMMVNRLREKMKPHDHLVATVHGTGYKLEV
ncbi:response regulator transcription factor [Paenibacillus sp. FSL M7-1455]|uniref:DNA-binding response regulator n=1 Tax=Paenibacillus cookii TaxID=157839 RepID=A0ABQ4LX25_9BACL|nr:response regulator transcription factor [Paenibacillus cookii]KHF35577.1 Phosphate regulon transcriptional regulatory protein PhoB [Paenibacillus sp. P1XP2]GIO67291.1 DNA-binding response regulator [Paenibacillus cookii]HWO54044.1 response regulator transcription factor [Paenibacillus cookii]